MAGRPGALAAAEGAAREGARAAAAVAGSRRGRPACLPLAGRLYSPTGAGNLGRAVRDESVELTSELRLVHVAMHRLPGRALRPRATGPDRRVRTGDAVRRPLGEAELLHANGSPVSPETIFEQRRPRRRRRLRSGLEVRMRRGDPGKVLSVVAVPGEGRSLGCTGARRAAAALRRLGLRDSQA